MLHFVSFSLDMLNAHKNGARNSEAVATSHKMESIVENEFLKLEYLC